MATIILVYGLPGSGKTYFATKLKTALGDRAEHYNADDVRKKFDDWDFSDAGRLRQAKRMRELAEASTHEFVILDFVCPRSEYRDIINADVAAYIARTPVRDFPDTTAIFERPKLFEYDYKIQDDTDVDEVIAGLVYYWLTPEDLTRPTALMIGRFQPFHIGHKELFKKALEKHGFVCIGIRNMPTSDKNPFTAEQVAENIKKELLEYAGRYIVQILPNIFDVVYGRDVGWTVTKIDLPPEIEAISATQIRAQMQK